MRSILYLLLCTSIYAPAQNGGHSQDSAEWKTFYTRQTSFRERGTRALEAENAREKSEICPNAQSTVEINECLARELGVTEKNYEDYIRAIGGLLRLKAPDDTEPVQAPNQGKGLDEAESFWNRYREVQCRVSSDQYFGGTIRPSIFLSCKQDLTRRHIHELESLYKELWK